MDLNDSCYSSMLRFYFYVLEHSISMIGHFLISWVDILKVGTAVSKKSLPANV
jgi:hypothetical protein